MARYDEKEANEIVRLNRDFKAITGDDEYLYISMPGDGQVKVVFAHNQASGTAEGLAYMKQRLAEARSDWRANNGPLDTEATDWISMWINNDGDHYETARTYARESIESLANYLTNTLNGAREQSSAWHTRRELSDNDMERIEWPEIASDLLAE